MNINQMFTYEKFKKMYLDRLKKPTTIWSIIVFIFSIGGMYATFNYRLNDLEEFRKEVNILELQKSIVAIQKDVERIKINMPTKF
jgi:hypothetical protein